MVRSAASALLAVLCSACAALGSSCGDARSVGTSGPSQSPSSARPTGTVLAVGATNIGAAEIDAVASWIAELYPESAQTHNRRRALTTLVLPRAALAQVHAHARVQARAEADAARAALSSGAAAPVGTRESELNAAWGELGLEIWGPAHGLALGAWSEVVEGIGRFLLLRVEEHSGGGPIGARTLRVRILEFPYVPADATVESTDADIDSVRLEIVDPAWEECVPIAWQYRMRGAQQGASTPKKQ